MIRFVSKELSVTEKNRKEYGEPYFYTSKLMFGSLTTECEKVLESYPFKRKGAISNQNKTKCHDEGMFILNILTVEAI